MTKSLAQRVFAIERCMGAHDQTVILIHEDELPPPGTDGMPVIVLRRFKPGEQPTRDSPLIVDTRGDWSRPLTTNETTFDGLSDEELEALAEEIERLETDRLR